MNIGSVSRDFMTQAVQSTNTNTQGRNSSIPPAATSSNNSAAQVRLSKPAELMQKLSALSQSDPAAFKDVAQKISNSFKSAAENATGDDAKRLSALADRFAQAAQSGDMSALRPPRRDGTEQAANAGGLSSQGTYAGAAHGHSRHHQPPSGAMRDAFSAALSLVDQTSNSDVQP